MAEDSKAAVSVRSGIVDDSKKKAGHRGFQSAEAMEAAVGRTGVVQDNEEPISAETADMTPKRAPAPDKAMIEAQDKMVEVRSPTFIEPFFYGKKQYTLPKGKTVLIPQSVKAHLEEKGKL